MTPAHASEAGSARRPLLPLRRGEVAVCVVSSAVLLLELCLVRLFDVLLNPSLGYVVLSCALFSLGFAGFFLALRPRSAPPDLLRLSILLAAATVLILPALGAIRFDLESIAREPLRQASWFVLLWAALGVPFFIFGTILCGAFARWPDRVPVLYGMNLVGSALGCVLPLPLIPLVGPGGALFAAAALVLVAAAILAAARPTRLLLAVIAAGSASVPFLIDPGRLEIREYVDKHGVRTFRDHGAIELTRWDLVSKIDVIPVLDDATGPGPRPERFKHVALDGGSQTTRFTPFDGDLDGLRRRLMAEPASTSDYFWQRGVLAAHYLKRDRGQEVLVIGSAGGQETLAALLFGARRIDAVEMVGALVDLARGPYADYTGRIFLRPEVRVVVGEGRSFLRARNDRFDVIQIFSNHTSSTMAAGLGVLEVVNLQTVEAYVEFFSHLKEDGVLQVNHQVYPRMVATAARAWRRLGRDGFRRHVAVFERDLPEDVLPVFLVKMSAWTAAELEELHGLLGALGRQEQYRYRLVEDPLHPEASFLPGEFYSGEMPAEFAARLPYRAAPCTDDCPYFNFLRKTSRLVEPGAARGLDRTTAALLNRQLLAGFVPAELLYLLFPGVIGVAIAILAVLLPLLPGGSNRPRWRGGLSSLVYFSCLGAGFIAIELALVQILVRPIGFPLHAYSTVLFTLLLGAGCGSLWLSLSGGGWRRRALPPFAWILAALVLFLSVHRGLFDLLLAAPLPVRMLGCAVLLLPLAFFLGMPFPLGLAALAERPAGAIPWAYGMNALFSVLGGVLAVIATIALGFRAALWLAAACYLVAWTVCPRRSGGSASIACRSAAATAPRRTSAAS